MSRSNNMFPAYSPALLSANEPTTLTPGGGGSLEPLHSSPMPMRLPVREKRACALYSSKY